MDFRLAPNDKWFNDGRCNHAMRYGWGATRGRRSRPIRQIEAGCFVGGTASWKTHGGSVAFNLRVDQRDFSNFRNKGIISKRPIPEKCSPSALVDK